jgi:hypothetical protein
VAVVDKVLALDCLGACRDMSPASGLVQPKPIRKSSFQDFFVLPTEANALTAPLCVWHSASCVLCGCGFPLLFLHQWGDRGIGHARRLLCYPMPGIQLALPDPVFSRQYRNATATVRPLPLHDLLLGFSLANVPCQTLRI